MPNTHRSADSGTALKATDTEPRDLEQPSLSDPVDMPVASLTVSDVLRAPAQRDSHARGLTDAKGEFAPVVVHRETMRVIDGVRRVRACQAQRRETVSVRFFEGNAADAFLLSVRLNVHGDGLPLTLSERRAAAARIVVSHSFWSDRTIASFVGLSANTVGSVRRRSAEATCQVGLRKGRDGRVRPVSAAKGRILAGKILQERPDTPIRQIAERAGISVGTAYDVRERLARGLPPVREEPYAVTGRPQPAGGDDDPHRPVTAPDLIGLLAKDPALKYTQQGRSLLNRLTRYLVSAEECRALLDTVPEHWLGTVTDLARSFAADWENTVGRLVQRGR